MPRKNPLAGIILDKTAEDQAKTNVDHFTEALVTEAKSLVFREGGKLVTDVHINHALRRIEERSKVDWKPEVGKVLGGTFLGAAIPGFTVELERGAAMSAGFLTGYVLLGLAGAILVSLSFRTAPHW